MDRLSRRNQNPDGVGLTRADAVLDAELAWKAGKAVRKASSCGVWDEYLRWMLSGATPVNISISIG